MKGLGAMRARRATGPLGAVVGLTMSLVACVDNPAPGNDREASLDPPPEPAAMADAATVLSGTALHLVVPETMSEADQQALSQLEGSCRFRMTEVGFPVLLYGPAAALKLNGKLVVLPRLEEGHYEAAGIEARIRPLEDGGQEGPHEFVLRLPGAALERGFHGFSTC